MMEEQQIEGSSTSPPPLPPRPRSIFLPPPVPPKPVSSKAPSRHNSCKETKGSPSLQKKSEKTSKLHQQNPSNSSPSLPKKSEKPKKPHQQDFRTNSLPYQKQKSDIKPILHRIHTTGAEGQIYDAIKLSPQLPLQEIINKYTSDIPFRLSVSESIYGVGGCSTLFDGELLDIHFLKETMVVHAVGYSGRKIMLPVNSSMLCSIMYDPVDNTEIAENGFSFAATSHLFQAHTLPKVVAVEESYSGKKKASSFAEGEVLVLKKFDGRKKLRCISIPSNEPKVLHESMKISFTTSIFKTKQYLSDLVQHLEFPVTAKLYHAEKKLQQQLGKPYTLTMLRSEKSLIASYHSHPHAGSIVEILSNVPINFEVVELEENDRQQLLEKSKTIFENFHPSQVKEVIVDVLATESKAQTIAFQSVQDGQAWRNGVTLTLKAAAYQTQTHSPQLPIASVESTSMSSDISATDYDSVSPIPLQKNHSYQQIDHSLLEYSTPDSTFYDCADISESITKSSSLQEELLELRRSNSILMQYVKDLRQKVDGDISPMDTSKVKKMNATRTSSVSDGVPHQDLDLASLSTDQVLILLDKLHLTQYKNKFKEEGITGSLLSEFDDEILENELGVSSKIHRIKLMRIIDGRQPVNELFNQ